jgi:membrane-bound lytic murein transglycosylase D
MVVLLGLAAGLDGRASAASGPRRSSSGGGSTAPVEESASERRAVRGSALDEDGGESAELRELRRFEEQAFPRGPIVSRPDAEGGSADPPTPLPGHWGGSGDIPPELRSPESTPRAVTTPPDPDSESLRALKLPDIPVRWDPQVLRYLDYFKNDPKGHLVMGNWLRRAGRFRDLFQKTLQQQGLPKDLFYVAMVESGFDTSARSRVGAGGIWQFMPGAARAYGVEIGYWIDGRRDPERSVDAAARYLKDLYVRFGSWPLVLAAYNAGYGAVLKSITRYNTNDFWELIRHEAGLPWESSIYVPKIMAAAIVGHNQEAFGFADVVVDPPFAYESVQTPAGTSLATVARAAGAKLEVIEALNPHLVRDRVPPGRSATSVRVPPGASAAYADALDAARGPGDRMDTVVLRFGETIDDVARACRITPRELRRLNGVKDSGELRAGVTVLVPKRPTAKDKDAAAKSNGTDGADDAPAAERESAPADDQVIVAVPDRVFSYEGRERVFYKTRDGDSLDDIGEAFGVKVDDLIEWNNLDAAAKLHPNMVVQIFVRKDFDPAAVVVLDAAHVRVVTLGSDEFLELEAAKRGKKRLFYQCKGGDTLARVGRRYGLTPGDLARINRFSYNTELRDGQRIVVYSPVGAPPHEVTMGMAAGNKRGKAGPSPAVGMSHAAKPSAPAGHAPSSPSKPLASAGAAGKAPVAKPSAVKKK